MLIDSGSENTEVEGHLSLCSHLGTRRIFFVGILELVNPLEIVNLIDAEHRHLSFPI